MTKNIPSRKPPFNQARVTATPIHKASQKKWDEPFIPVVEGTRAGLDNQSFNKLVKQLKKEGKL